MTSLYKFNLYILYVPVLFFLVILPVSLGIYYIIYEGNINGVGAIIFGCIIYGITRWIIRE